MLAQMAFLLLPVAATYGWFMGRQETRKISNRKRDIRLRQDYFEGLNYLINDQSDKAVDVFIKLLEVDNHSIEMPLALGNLFRQRGEVDRAIRVHQSLIERSDLSRLHQIQALLALGEDYLRAGVLDRAEDLFLELVKLGGESQLSLRFLLQIYQKEKDWSKAIETAKKLEGFSGERIQGMIAHYYCELAIQKKENGQLAEAQNYLKQAQAIDFSCARASMILGNIAQERNQYREAIRYYKQVEKKDSSYFSEVVDWLVRCYLELKEEDICMEYLQECLNRRFCFSVARVIAEYIRNTQSETKAIEFISQQIIGNPSLHAVSYLVSLHLKNTLGENREKLLMLQNFIYLLLTNKPKYQCAHCGFSSKMLYWLCPSCHHWASIKPMQGLVGN